VSQDHYQVPPDPHRGDWRHEDDGALRYTPGQITDGRRAWLTHEIMLLRMRQKELAYVEGRLAEYEAELATLKRKLAHRSRNVFQRRLDRGPKGLTIRGKENSHGTV